jgi:hypothetical protein
MRWSNRGNGNGNKNWRLLRVVNDMVVKLRLNIFPLNIFADFTIYNSGFSGIGSSVGGLHKAN